MNGPVYYRAQAIRLVLNSILSSTKKYDIFKRVRVESDERKYKVTSLDVETRWSSTFRMVRAVYRYSYIKKAVLNSIPGLSSIIISENEWQHMVKVNDFRKRVASVTEHYHYPKSTFH